jgi:hypothetical protein
MYDFYFGSLEHILENEEEYLLFVKRLLPRWVNSIPDSEYLAIFDILNKINLNDNKPIIAETGSGASSLVMLYYAMKNNGIVYTWDTNGSKGSFLKGVANETFGQVFNRPLSEHWRFIAYSSINKYLGINILHELDERIDFCFIDSLHTLDHLLGELELLRKNFKKEVFVAIDDANYKQKSVNVPYINMFRKKLGLSPIKEPVNNECREYYLEVEEYLLKYFNVKKINDKYKKLCSEDIYFSYYESDKKVASKMGMEKFKMLKHRFDAWHVTSL